MMMPTMTMAAATTRAVTTTHEAISPRSSAETRLSPGRHIGAQEAEGPAVSKADCAHGRTRPSPLSSGCRSEASDVGDAMGFLSWLVGVGDGSDVAAGEGGEGGVEDEDAVAGHEQHAGQQHLLGDGLGRVLQGGGFLEAKRLALASNESRMRAPSPAWAMARARSVRSGRLKRSGEGVEPFPGLLAIGLRPQQRLGDLVHGPVGRRHARGDLEGARPSHGAGHGHGHQ